VNDATSETKANTTANLTQGRFVSGIEFTVVVLAFGIMAVGLVSLAGLIISLLCAPESFWSSIAKKIDDWFSNSGKPPDCK
jgi:hypothetical protein